ncbi:histidine kinase [Labilibaculum sp.]|uniref:sensor histidine kinase n=1 Tax=Labilibaculum sp. TaxID=2060723 RepID=UPI002AA88985|nr:histidine kinase [Labilibaculum sp.]MBN2598526.1 histidine kinase [Marinifilaceae bacterium]
MAKILSISDKKISVGLHVIAWIIIISIPFYLNSAFDSSDRHHLYQFYVHTLSAGFIFYVSYLWLIPSFFLQDRKVSYLVILSGLILGTYFLTSYINDTILFDSVQNAKFQEVMKKLTEDNNIRPPMKAFGIYNHILVSFLISGFAMGLGVMKKLKQNEEKQKELEKEKLNSELAFLKNQVSPHFFFNTLNNIYSLIGIDGSTAQESVLKLSKLMRYLLYESEHGETLMSHEIDFMSNYIDLMKLRLSSRVELQIEFPKDYTDFSIPPLLFVPFVENAFKHGLSYRDRSFITIGMEIEDDQIHFYCENSVGQRGRVDDLQYSGIGLENVKKRLNLLFPDQYDLKISNNEPTFKVDLHIKKLTT